MLTFSALGQAGEVSLEDLWRHAEFQGMVLSPSGEYLAAMVPDEAQSNVVILDIRQLPVLKLSATFRLARNEHARELVWVSDERLVFTSVFQQGRLATPSYSGRIYASNADGSRQLQIYGPRAGSLRYRMVSLIHPLPDDEQHVLVAERAHDRERPIAYRMNLYRENLMRRVAVSPLERGSLGADLDGEIRFAWGYDEDGDQMFAWRADGDAPWTNFENPFDGDIAFWGFNEDETHVYVSSRDQENLGVFRVDLASGEYQRLLGGDTFAAALPIWDAAGEILVGAVFATPIPEVRFIDPDHPTARVWQNLQAALPLYQARIFNFTEDGRGALAVLYNDREPAVFMFLDVESMALTRIAAARSWIRPERMAAMQPISFTARDGLELHGYLTLPPGSNGQNLPTIVEVHGGPYGLFDQWGFDSIVQTWALNGYAVLQINYRGSGGRSHQFQHDAFGQWGAEMQDDLTDGTLWAVEEGIADPDRICISGGSYGGYAAINGVVREPDLYRCGFAFGGIYDLELFKRRGSISQFESGQRYLDRALGTDPVVLRARSPVHHVDRITADLFIAHGSEDIRAHYAQYHALIDALEQAGIPHQKLWVRGEGHGFYALENNVLLYGQALDFFDRNIGSGYRARDPEMVQAALARAAGK